MNGYEIAIQVLCAQAEGFTAIKKDRARFSYLAPAMILLWSLFSNIVSPFLVHYPLQSVDVKDVNFAQQLFAFALPFFLWIFALYYVTCVFSGETMLREAWAATCYALLPYALTALPLALLTNAFGSGAAGLFHTVSTLVQVWVVLLVLAGIREMNSYSVPRTLLVALAAVLAVLFIAVILVLLYVLGAKLLAFVGELWKEYRLLLFH